MAGQNKQLDISDLSKLQEFAKAQKLANAVQWPQDAINVNYTMTTTGSGPSMSYNAGAIVGGLANA